MSSPNPSDSNPYQPPATTPNASSPTIDQMAIDRDMIKKFRDQSLALGVLWIFLGCVAGAIAVAALSGSRDMSNFIGGQTIMLFFVFGVAALWLVVGVMTCLKQLWAVYLGLGLTYLSALGQLLNLSLCGVVLMALAIVQGHRVIGWAKKMRAAGLPLTAKPSELKGDRSN